MKPHSPLTAFLLPIAGLILSALSVGAADLVVPETVLFERGIEFANPGLQPLQLDMALPKQGNGPFPAIVCIRGGGFRAGTREGYVGLEQAPWIVDRLKAASVEAELLAFEGAGHGFKGADAENAEKAMLAFFAKHLHP